MPFSQIEVNYLKKTQYLNVTSVFHYYLVDANLFILLVSVVGHWFFDDLVDTPQRSLREKPLHSPGLENTIHIFYNKYPHGKK